jgi:thermolysin
MKNILLALLLSALIIGLLFGADNDDGFMGPNNLRNNQNLTLYQENENGVVEFVQGELMTRKAARGNEFQTALDFFENNKGAFKMANPSEELALKRVDSDPQGKLHVRMNQTYQGLRVIGGEMIAHFTADGSLKTVNGNYEPYIDIDPNPDILSAQAINIAYEDLRQSFGESNPGEAELVLFPWEDEIYLAWRMFLYSDTPMGRWEYFIDAKTGEIIFKANRIMDENDIGTGTNVMGLPRNHIDTDFTGSTYEMKDYTRQLNNNPHGHDGLMPDGNYIQTNIAGSTLPGSIATDDDNIWGTTSTQAPAVDGHVYTGLVYDYMVSHFNRNGYDNNGASMLTIVNYSGDGDNNAYWDGSRIVIWSWATGWRSLAGCPDVIAHEWGHAITEYTSGLVYQKEPGALNESFSDMIGAAFEFAHDTLDTPDWLMGENGQLSGDGFRDMSDPHAKGDPDYYGTSDPYWIDVVNCSPSPFNDYCGVHTNSGVGNKWFYLLSDGGTHHDVTVTGIGVQNAMSIAYQANAFYWTSTTDYHQAALATISAALDLDSAGTWATEASHAWNAVGVSTPGPSVTFAYPNGVPETLIPEQSTAFDVVVSGFLGGTPVPSSGLLHYRINGGAYTSIQMTEVSPNNYEATLPPSNCDSIVEFYVSADEVANGTFNDPGPESPFAAVVATAVTVSFEDNFETDQGWTVSGSVTDGPWERGVPIGGGDRGDPPTDFDGSGACYLTDNQDDNSDVDGGTTTLISPNFDLSAGDGKFHYARWFNNMFGAAPYTDVMEIYISNDDGTNWTLVETVGPTGAEVEGGWYEKSFWASDFVTPTNQMKLRFDASDLGDGSVVEAAVDDVWVKIYECYDSTLIIITDTLPDWTMGMPYTMQLQHLGGSGEITWSDKNGDLAGTGLSLSSSGLLLGTPGSSGEIIFTAHVEDEVGEFDERTYSFTINEEILITTVSLPDWTAGKEYQQQLEFTGGTSPQSWSDKFGDLDGTGLSLSSSGLLSGTVTSEMTISFTAEVTDFAGATDERVYQFEVNPAVSIVSLLLPDWTTGIAYSEQLLATGGTGNLIWSDHSLGLEGTGLNISVDGAISGTPTGTGPISFTARAIDNVGAFDTQEFSFTINPAVSITTESMPDWTAGIAYEQQLEATGGTGELNWFDFDNGLDGTGLTLSLDGIVSGTPAATDPISFTARAIDVTSSSDEKVLQIVINPEVSITTSVLPEGLETEPYSYQLQSEGGTAPLAWSDLNNDLDGTGLSLSADGILSGTPPEAGIFTFTAQVMDAPGSFDQQEFSVNIGVPYICGDSNGDEAVNVSDAVMVINYVFLGSTAPDPLEAADPNCDGGVNVSDAVMIINYVFVGGNAPCDTNGDGEPDC